MTEAGEYVSAPAGEVYGVERDVRPLVGRIVGKEFGRAVEGVQACVKVAMGCEGFTMSGRQPCPQDARCGGVGATSGAVKEVDRVAGRSSVDKDERLFGGSVGFVWDGVGLSRRRTGEFIVLPGVGHVAEVECLPSGEGVHFGEQGSERFSGAGSEAVRGEPFDLADLGVEFVADDDRA